MMLNIELKEFQEQCVSELLNEIDSKGKEIILKSPTGSGKTIILIDIIDKYLRINKEAAFIWLSTGKGELEEQSKSKFEKFMLQRNAKNLDDVLQTGFSKEDIAFMNWESITKTGNKAIKEQEQKNLYERIQEGLNNGINFKIIIDEEHVNKTEKADKLLKFFNSNKVIRVSATPKVSKGIKVIEIDEKDVIDSGLITKNLFINEKVNSDDIFDDDTEYLLNLAINKQIEIKKEYDKLSKSINPLILIQFASETPAKIKLVEEILKDKGYTYDNGKVGIWLSNNKKNIEDIDKKDNSVIFLLMKQAISTGWDCPRAKILVKLRDHMSEDFEIQTIGRIRRTIDGKHYENILLDSCYLYTFDRKYVNAVKQKYNGVETKLLFLKDEYKGFKLIKEIKNSRYSQYGSVEALKLIKKYFINKYKLTDNKIKNKDKLDGSYKFDRYIVADIAKDIIHGEINEKSIEEAKKVHIDFEVNTHRHGIDLQHSIDILRKEIGMSYNQTRTILERLFFPRKNSYYKTTLINLKRKEFYAFIINNEDTLKHDLREVVNSPIEQQTMLGEPAPFTIPPKCIVKYDTSMKDVETVMNNVYKEYTTDIIRSMPETKFENYCQKSSNVEWIYKNGESSKEFFSLVYRDNANKQWLFYPDYIVKTKNDLWIIETKGGENKSGQTKNIDIKSKFKFEALKIYAENHNFKWGFVRDYDKNDKLYLNNTEYTEDMSSSNWILLEKFI